VRVSLNWILGSAAAYPRNHPSSLDSPCVITILLPIDSKNLWAPAGDFLPRGKYFNIYDPLILSSCPAQSQVTSKGESEDSFSASEIPSDRLLRESNVGNK